jgi:hypothetical protein
MSPLDTFLMSLLLPNIKLKAMTVADKSFKLVKWLGLVYGA